MHSGLIPRLIAIVTAFALTQQDVVAVDVEGFTEPERTVRVAAADSGIVTEIPVDIGDYVEAGEVIARLDDRIHRILLETARKQKDARGRLLAAKAEVKLREERVRKLVDLRGEGFGRKEEVERAHADLEIAQAELQSVIEDLSEKLSRYHKAQADLDRRTVTAPISGHIVERSKQPGEYVASTDPYMLTIACTKTMRARVSVTPSLARTLVPGQQVMVNVGSSAKPVQAIVDQISPIVDAESGTVRVKVRMANDDDKILGGQRCLVRLSGETDSVVAKPVSDFERITRQRELPASERPLSPQATITDRWLPRGSAR